MNITARIGRRRPLPPNVSSDVNSDGDRPLKLLCEPHTAAQGRILLDRVEPPAVPFFPSGRTVSIPTTSRGVANTPRSPRRISLTPPLPARPAPAVPNINFNFDRNGRQAVSLRSVRSPSMRYTRKFSESPRYRISRRPRDAIYKQDTKRVGDYGDDQRKASQWSGRSGFLRLDLKGLDVSVGDEVAQDIPRASAEEEDDPASITTRVSNQGQRHYTVQNDTDYSDYPSVLMSPTEHARHAVGFHYKSFQSPCINSNLTSLPISQKFQPPSTGPSSPSDLITSLTPLHSTDHPNIELSVANSSHSQTLRYSHSSFPFPMPGISETHSASKKTVHAEEFLATTLSARLKELTLRIALTRCELSEYTNPTLALTTSLYVALPLAQQLRYTPLEGRCWYWVGRAEAARGNLQKAQEALERSLEAGLEEFSMKERGREGRDVRAVLEIVRARIASEIDRGEGSPGVSPTLLSPLGGVGVRLRDIRQIQKQMNQEKPERLGGVGWIETAEKESNTEIERQAGELHKRVPGWEKDVYHAGKTALGDFKAKEMDSRREGYHSHQNTSLANQTIQRMTNGRLSTPGELQAKSDTIIPATEGPSINGVFVMPQYMMAIKGRKKTAKAEQANIDSRKS